MDEFELIRKLTQGRTGAEAADGVVVGIGDDAAVVAPGAGMQMVFTCDTVVEKTHFLPWTMDDFSTGWKVMASNISDLAAMGAVPRYALTALSAPQGFPLTRLEQMYKGLYACADEFGVAVIGGDTTRSPQHVSVTVTAIGEVAAGRALLRSGARDGDVVFVTGPLGLSAAGLDVLMRREAGAAEKWAPLVQAHQRPRPQVAAGRALVGLAHALNDVSDGLASEAWEIAEASGVRVVLEAAKLPVPAELREYAAFAGRSALDFVLGGGEDYELVGTASAERADELMEELRRAGADPVIVGRVEEGDPEVVLIHSDGNVEVLSKRGYNHFV